MCKKSFEFSQKGLNEAIDHKDYVGITREYLEKHPQILPLTLAFVIGASAVILPISASTVAFKASTDTSIVAFKFVVGGF